MSSKIILITKLLLVTTVFNSQFIDYKYIYQDYQTIPTANMMYTCNTCCLEFETSELQRTHMKCDWHRYNLKRRVAQLPPVSEATFNGKMQQMKESTEDDSAKDKVLTKKEQRRKEKEALLEKKRQLLEIARQNMLKAMQEQQKKAESEGIMTVEEPLPIPLIQPKDITQTGEENEEAELTPDQLAEKLMAEKIANKVDIPTNVCLFCNHNQKEKHLSTFKDMEENIDHMFKCHGFYIPEQKYLVDKEGLIKYMSEKIGLGNVCIVCNYQGRNLEAVRNHMLSKRHCKIPYESTNDKLEISEFYDFTSTYQDYKKPETVIVSAADVAVAGEDDGEWEDVTDEEEGEGEEDEIPEEYLYSDGMALHLPTGIKVGHRSLQRYFNQVVKPERELTEGQGTLVAADTRSFVSTFDKKTVQVQQRAWQSEVKDKKRDDKRSAKFINQQAHYRDQLLQ